MHSAWIDLRGLGETAGAVAEEAVHAGIAGIVADDPERLAGLPPTVTKVGAAIGSTPSDELVAAADVVLVGADDTEALSSVPESKRGVFVTVRDHDSLEQANHWARTAKWTFIHFTDPTKIPLEIVLAAADSADGQIVTVAGDLEEAWIILDVLERGSDGVLLAPDGPGGATELAGLCRDRTGQVDLQELTVLGIKHLGLGDRVCVDTCSHFREDEGILVGSYASGMILCCSETHPLPYMPTRPFRVNAGALHSYTLGPENRTRYLSELVSGSELVAVDVKGATRRVSVGRAKLETRPMLQIRARAVSGREVDLIVQDDWHVRVLGPGGAVLNVTELGEGSVVLGAVFEEPRHVGYAVKEFLLEK